MKTMRPLKYYVDKLKNGEKFSLARYGDGEILCMAGVRGQNCDGSKYTPELRQALLDSMKHRNDPTFIYGLQRVLPADEKRMIGEYPDVNWHDSEIFSEALIKGELYPLIEQLRKMRVVVVGNSSIKEFVMKELGAFRFIEVHPSRAFEDRGTINQIIGSVVDSPTPVVYLFSCGMTANTIISQNHKQVSGWLIDLGHIWDPFVGKRSRGYLEELADEQINKNLCP